MSDVVVTGHIVTPDGKGIKDVRVVASLSGGGPPYFESDSDRIIAHSRAYYNTDSSGYFYMKLRPNSEIMPAGSVYTFTIGSGLLADSAFYSMNYNIDTVTFTNITVVPSTTTVKLSDLVQEV
jgi:hypothetical protein